MKLSITLKYLASLVLLIFVIFIGLDDYLNLANYTDCENNTNLITVCSIPSDKTETKELLEIYDIAGIETLLCIDCPEYVKSYTPSEYKIIYVNSEEVMQVMGDGSTLLFDNWKYILNEVSFNNTSYDYENQVRVNYCQEVESWYDEIFTDNIFENYSRITNDIIILGNHKLQVNTNHGRLYLEEYVAYGIFTLIFSNFFQIDSLLYVLIFFSILYFFKYYLILEFRRLPQWLLETVYFVLLVSLFYILFRLNVYSLYVSLLIPLLLSIPVDRSIDYYFKGRS